MVGTLVNVGTIVGGSLIGGLARKVMNEKLSNALMNAMGFRRSSRMAILSCVSV